MRLLLVIALCTLLAPGQAPTPPAAPPECARGEQLLGQRKFKEAAAAFEECLRRHPAEVSAYQGAAMALVRMRRFAEATPKLQFALQLAPENPGVLFDLSLCLQSQARWGEAIVHWRRLEALSATDLKVSLLPQIPYYRGTCALKLDLTPEAIEALSRAVSLAPENLDYRLNLAGVQLNAGRYAEAAEEFAVLVERAPSNAGFHHHLGEAYLNLGEDALAEKHLKESRRLDPRSDQTSLHLAKLYLRQKKNELAYSLYLEGVEKNPLSADGWYNLARLAKVMNHPDEVEEFTRKYEEARKKQDDADNRSRELERRIGADPKDLQAYIDLVTPQLQNQAFDVAEEWLVRLLAVAPRHEVGLLNLASLLTRKGLVEDAIWELDKILETDPGHPWANLETGRLYGVRRNWPSAVEHLERCLDRIDAKDDRFLQAVEMYGQAAFDGKLLARAAAPIERALGRLAPENPAFLRVALRFAQASLETKTPLAAIPYLETAASRQPKASPQRIQALKALAALAEAAGDPQRAQAYLEEAKTP